MPVRTKICGITRVEDALQAAAAGADAIGMVFYAKSPRHVSIEQAAEILAVLPPFVTSVGLFVDADEAYVREVLNHVPLDLLQFHGDETAHQCRRYGRPYIKALRVRQGEDIAARMAEYDDARGILLDTFVEGVPGGTGQAFDWGLIPADCTKPIILAGGLTPENVTQAIAVAHPYAVDVSGGVEREKGIKSPEKVAAFIARVRNAGH